jgi:hypothetical protein
VRTSNPAFPIAYTQWCRHRPILIVAIAILLVTAAVYAVVGALAEGHILGMLAVLSVIPLIPVFGFVMNSSLLVDEAGSLSSGYVKAMFTLPLRTHSLVVWPMALGSLSAGCLWVATVFLIYWPLGLHPPLVMPALGFAALMVWVQAVSWMPWAKGGLRELACLAILTPLAALPIWLLWTANGTPSVIGLMFLGYILAAYPAAYAAVASSRRGEVWPLWPSLPRLSERGSRATSAGLPSPFSSPAQAQFWYEWRCHGWVYPVYLGSIFFVIMGVIIWGSAHSRTLDFRWAIAFLMSLPIMMAGAIGPNLCRNKPFWIKGSGSSTFLATRPISSAGLVMPKFQMAFLSGLLTWLIVMVGIAICIVATGNLDQARSLSRIVFASLSGWRACAVVAAALVLLPGMTWKQLTDFSPFALTGRRAITEGTVIAGTVLFMSLGGLGLWLYTHPDWWPRLLPFIPWLVVAVALIKATTAVASFHWALRLGLLNWRAVAIVTLIWLGLCVLAMTLAELLLPAPAAPVSKPTLFIALALLMPICRFPLSVLATEWNRHR